MSITLKIKNNGREQSNYILLIEKKNSEAVKYIKKSQEIATKYQLKYTFDLIQVELKEASAEYRDKNY